MGIFTIQRIPIHNSEELNESLNSIKLFRPNMINICPGIMPKIIKRVYEKTKFPIIASGLIEDKKDIELALASGAFGISSTKTNTWYMY
jgi:glycerol uptake operon antiterminator